MDKGNRTTSIVIGAIAAAAGVAIVAYLWRWRLAVRGADPSLRSVSDILDDCYTKMHQLQQNLSQLPSSASGGKG